MYLLVSESIFPHYDALVSNFRGLANFYTEHTLAVVTLNVVLILLSHYVYLFGNERFQSTERWNSQISFLLLTTFNIAASFILSVTFLQDASTSIGLINFAPLSIVICIVFGSSFQTIVCSLFYFVFVTLFSQFLVGPEGSTIPYYVDGLSLLVIGLLLHHVYEKWLYNRKSFIFHFWLVLLPTFVFTWLHFPSYNFLEFSNTWLLLSLLYWLILTVLEAMHNKKMYEATVEQVERSQFVTGLAASIAHEIRNPLTMSKGFLQLLQRDLSEHPLLYEYVEQALQGINDADRVIEDFNTYAKPDVNEPQLLEVETIIKQTIEFIQSYARHHQITVHCQLDVDQCFIVANEQRLKQCLVNLMKNGIESMQSGQFLTITSFVDSNKVIIEIIDEGCGMTKEQMARLGTPFYTTKERGTGLGVMVVKRLLQAMNAGLHIWSHENVGTTARITFHTVTETVDVNSITFPSKSISE
ncbi:MAG: ATP-binding protein, partial [Bacilli bacterium]